MARHDVDGLDERVRRLQAVVDHLDDEHETVRSQIDLLETAVGGSPANDGAGGSTPTDDFVFANLRGSDSLGASDEEVEEAIRSIEGDGDTEDTDEIDDDILVV